MGAERSRPLHGPLPVMVAARRVAMMAAPGVRQERLDTVSDPCGQHPDLIRDHSPGVVPDVRSGRAMFLAASPGTGGAELCASRRGVRCREGTSGPWVPVRH
jgi:hypothetical protein